VSSAEEQQPERLQKVMARAGIASRRVCEQMIDAGRVTLDGRPATLGDRALPGQRIEVDGIPVLRDPSLVHYLLNKPAGVVSTADDPQGRRTVVDLVPAERRVFPVGRLDADTEGLIIVTNDGELTNLLTHPSHGVPKEYLAHVEGVPGRAALRRLREGVELDDGVTAPAEVSMPQDGLIRLTIHEGRNRQVRRMCEAVGHRVIRLVRVRIGPIVDSRLGPGEWRELEPDEVRLLYGAVER
jgi:23S rRNA pseudouridine2605 synthase